MWNSLFGPRGASEFALQVDGLILFLSCVTAVFVLSVFGVALLLSLRYKARPGHQADPSVASNGLIAMAVLAPLAVTLSIFIWSSRIEAGRRANLPLDTEVSGSARQWMWTFRHADGRTEINALHVPVNTPVSLELQSEDVLHRLAIPALRIQAEVLPGMPTQLQFQSTREGSYHFFCTEFCGMEHSIMTGTVYVLDPITYEHWVTGDSASMTPEQAGELLFGAFRCDSCHAPSGEGTGPSLLDRFGQDVALEDGSSAGFDGAYVRESLLEPTAKLAAGFQPVMPSYKGQLDENQIAQITAYLESLTDG